MKKLLLGPPHAVHLANEAAANNPARAWNGCANLGRCNRHRKNE